MGTDIIRRCLDRLLIEPDRLLGIALVGERIGEADGALGETRIDAKAVTQQRDAPLEMQNLSGNGTSATAEKQGNYAELMRAAAEGSAVEGGGEVEMTLEKCMQQMNLGYVQDCSPLQ